MELCAQASHDVLIDRLAHSRALTSIGGRIGVPHLLGYSASKFALLGLREGLAAEFDRSGVRVTSIVPWLMRTGSCQNAELAGKPQREMKWFSLGMLPGLSVDPRRAARQIVDAIQHGDPILHVGVASAINVFGQIAGLSAAIRSCT
jgi:short-subunit dehydrogenase